MSPDTSANKMYIHAVMFRWKDGVAPQTIDNAMRELRELKAKIPGMVELTSGKNISPRSQGYTHGAVMKFADEKALQAYGPHPAHQRILEILRPIMAQAAELDYPING